LRILFVVPYAPTPIRVRPHNLVKHLAARGHSLTLATLCGGPAEQQHLAQLQALGVQVIAHPLPRWRSLLNCVSALPTPLPLQAVYCRSAALRACIEQELNSNLTPQLPSLPGKGAIRLYASPLLEEGKGVRYDVIHVEHLRGAYYGLNLEGAPVVWDSVDCISYLFEQAARHSRSLAGRLMARLDLGRTRRYEGWLAGQFERVLVTSQADRLALEELAAGSEHAPVTVLPNGVDLDYFTPGPARWPNTLVYLGKMSYHANVTAALHLVRRIMPMVWEKRPQARLMIVGANPPRHISKLATEFPGKIEVTGTVPDVRPYLRRASVAVAPVVYGAGIQNKVLEAMACGAPVVAMPQAVAALQAVDGQDLLAARSSDEFAQAVLRLLEEPGLAAGIGAAARHYVETHHAWDEIVIQLEGIYQQTIADQSRLGVRHHGNAAR
jgi:glycosyltransferase involved in cell wall biosynthesis